MGERDKDEPVEEARDDEAPAGAASVRPVGPGGIRPARRQERPVDRLILQNAGWSTRHRLDELVNLGDEAAGRVL